MLTDVTNSDQSTPVSTFVIQHFSIFNICSKVIKIYNGSPGEVAKHLKNAHKITENSTDESRSSKKIRLDFADLNELTEDSNSNSSEAIPKIEKIHLQLIKLILRSNLPFNILESVIY